jgi:hypothetical protein
MECENYRGISLLNTTYKLLSNILLNRLNPYIKKVVGDYQASFMLGKSRIDQIHLVKQVVEMSHEFDKDIHLLFVDFKAAYDSINREKLWEVMGKLGIPAKLTRVIKACTYNSKSKVSFGGDLSEEFPVTTGLRQGDALSPALFNIALESVMRVVMTQAKGIELENNQNLAAVAYADDIVLLAESNNDLKNTTDVLAKEGKKIGLKISETKTKYMILGPFTRTFFYARIKQAKNTRLECGVFKDHTLGASHSKHVVVPHAWRIRSILT